VNPKDIGPGLLLAATGIGVGDNAVLGSALALYALLAFEAFEG
jgi:hypothetical protein